MIERLLPAGAAGAEAFDDAPESTLYPVEAAVLARAVPKRRREFTTVRFCARQALGQLGIPPAPLLPGERGAPRWPDGVVGSMTHCDGYRAAVVARTGTARALGVDAEPHQPLPDRVLRMVARPEELRMLAALPADPAVRLDRLLFCAKEAAYKAWSPLTRERLDLAAASVALRADGTLAVDPPGGRAAAALTGLSGRWLADRGLLVTVVVAAAGR
jgi:4'-phosphopantetheinyl transferase EntD